MGAMRPLMIDRSLRMGMGSGLRTLLTVASADDKITSTSQEDADVTDDLPRSNMAVLW